MQVNKETHTHIQTHSLYFAMSLMLLIVRSISDALLLYCQLCFETNASSKTKQHNVVRGSDVDGDVIVVVNISSVDVIASAFAIPLPQHSELLSAKAHSLHVI